MEFEITPERLAQIRAELRQLLGPGWVDEKIREICLPDESAYGFLYRPDVPAVLRGLRGCDDWIESMRAQRPPQDLEAFGPFVRFGMAVDVARSLPRGPERIEELGRLARAEKYEQLRQKLFELEITFMFPGQGPIEFGELNGNPDVWLGTPPDALPMECKDASAVPRPPARCRDAWKRVMIESMKEMQRRGICVALCLRAQTPFGHPDVEGLADTVRRLLEQLQVADKEPWAVADCSDGRFNLYAYRVGEWDRAQESFAVPFGLDGEFLMRGDYEITGQKWRNPLILGLKLQSAFGTQDRIQKRFDEARNQLRKVRPDGPGIIAVRLPPVRAGDLYEIDQVLRKKLKSTSSRHVSAVILAWDAADWSELRPISNELESGRFNFHLRTYTILNTGARRTLPWADSRSRYFPRQPKAVIRTPEGELVPYDFEAEEEALSRGTKVELAADRAASLGRQGQVAPFPHRIQEGGEIGEKEGRMTLYWKFDRELSQALAAPEPTVFLLEWFLVGDTQFRVYRDLYWNLRVNRRFSRLQDNLAIDLRPWLKAKELCLQFLWSAETLAARLHLPDGSTTLSCKAARTSLF